mmetsp:Transcript_23327/g.30436  ORF Transcript_23327/g.30436 Transcript_23327/m.30436 type:complete len:80 (-) Transcript_23327:367-606(-)
MQLSVQVFISSPEENGVHGYKLSLSNDITDRCRSEPQISSVLSFHCMAACRSSLILVPGCSGITATLESGKARMFAGEA